MDEIVLDFEWKTGGEAIDVIFAGMPSFRLEKELMLFFFGEFYDFIFNRGAITRPDPFDAA